jgi:hypothetical protein
MLLSDDYKRHSTYFGVYSAAQARRVSDLLNSLNIRYRFVPEQQDEGRLRAWTAWDPAAKNPNEGHELYIHTEDLDKVGTKIVQMYPERKFGAV